MKKLRGVAVGTGYFSQFQYEAWNRMENVIIVAVSSRRLEKAQAICDQFNIAKAYDNFEQMLIEEQPDFVDIITPPETHTQFCTIAIKHGIDIICQKPLAPTYKESVALVEAIKKSSVRMMVHENFRFQPWYREIKKLLNQRIIGDKIHSINLRMRMGDGWQEDAYMNRQPYFREMPQLLIYETGVHLIDVFRYLLGNVTQVYAKLKTLNNNIKGEDFAWVQFEFENGALGFLDANRFNENTSEDPRLTFGNICLDGNKGTIRLFDDGRIAVQKLGEEEKPHEYAYEKINFSGDCVYNTQVHFIACLRSGTPFETDIEKYLNNIIVQEAIYEANEKGVPIKLN